MNQSIFKLLLLCATSAVVLVLSACGGSSDTDMSDSLVQMDSENEHRVAADGDATSLQCDDGQAIDQAEFLSTEIDRQWTCTVTSGESVGVDGVYFSRSGLAVFSRFGDVYWNRNLQSDAIHIASPFIAPHVMQDISSANTTLQFNLSDDSGSTQSYDCVLVQREDIS